MGSEKGLVIPVQCGGILAAAEPAAEGVGGAGGFRLVLDVDVEGDAHEDAGGRRRGHWAARVLGVARRRSILARTVCNSGTSMALESGRGSD